MSATRTTPALTLAVLGPDHDSHWDALVGGSHESGFMQSSAWAAFKEMEGYVCRRVGFFRGDELIGGASLLHYAGDGGESLVLCPEGPVLPWHDAETARAALRLLTDDTRAWTAERACLGLRIEPHLPPPRPSLLRNWARAPIDLTPIHTLVVALDGDDDALLAAMRPKGRYNARLAERHGVTVRRSSRMEDLAAFHELFAATSERDGFYSEPYGFFVNLGAALFPGGNAELILAEWRGELLAALLIVYCGLRATYLYGASSSRHRHVMPTYAAHRAAMRAARDRGCTEYDLYGYDPFGIPDHLYAGISRFKLQLGGARRDQIGAHDLLFYDRVADRVMERLTAASDRG